MFVVYFRKNELIFRRHGVDVSDDVTTTKAIRRINGKIFLCVLIPYEKFGNTSTDFCHTLTKFT